MNKKYYSWDDVHKSATQIALQMYKENWRPDYIVGITRGGMPLAVILSHMIDTPCNALKVSLRDGDSENESNCWMAEDAFGYTYVPDRNDVFGEVKSVSSKKKNILIVDDINDTGATFNWIMEDWQKGCLPDNPNWSTVWGQNVRFAVMTDNLASNFKGTINYWWDEVNKAEEDVWLVYPYEYD
jgi:hypoxanthine phosphoribosyltransferase